MSIGFSFPPTIAESADLGDCFEAFSRKYVKSEIALRYAKNFFPLAFLKFCGGRDCKAVNCLSLMVNQSTPIATILHRESLLSPLFQELQIF